MTVTINRWSWKRKREREKERDKGGEKTNLDQSGNQKFYHHNKTCHDILLSLWNMIYSLWDYFYTPVLNTMTLDGPLYLALFSHNLEGVYHCNHMMLKSIKKALPTHFFSFFFIIIIIIIIINFFFFSYFYFFFFIFCFYCPNAKDKFWFSFKLKLSLLWTSKSVWTFRWAKN